jgi:hypothetical protein
MQFDKAYRELLKGKKIRRKEWEHLQHMRLIEGTIKTYRGDYTHFYQDANILISTGWIVLDGDGTELTFIEALEELKAKRKLTCKQWIEEKKDKFIFVDQNNLAMCTAIEFMFMPTYQCLLAQDWELMS